MTKVSRLLIIDVVLTGLVIVSSARFSTGQATKKGASGLPKTTVQTSPAKKVSALAEAVDSRFSLPGLLTYQPIKGDLAFAMQLQPKLEATLRRPRDYLIIMSTAATQGGA